MLALSSSKSKQCQPPESINGRDSTVGYAFYSHARGPGFDSPSGITTIRQTVFDKA